MKTSTPVSSRATRAPSQTRRRRQVPPPPPAPSIPFNVFIAYADIPAAGRAMSAINEVLRASNHNYALRPMLWRFDQLAAAKWRQSSITDASEASVVVLASSSTGDLATEVDAWVTHFLVQRRGRPATIIAILGEEEAWTISIEATQTAQRAMALRPEEQLVA